MPHIDRQQAPQLMDDLSKRIHKARHAAEAARNPEPDSGNEPDPQEAQRLDGVAEGLVEARALVRAYAGRSGGEV